MADKEAIYAAWDGNTKVEDIAAAQGVSIPRVYQIMAARGKPLGKAGRPRTVQPAEVIAAIESGVMQTNAADTFGITRGRVTQILDEHAPALLAKLRAERAARPVVGSRTAYRRDLKVRKAAGSVILRATPVAKVAGPGTGPKAPKNWQTATKRAVAQTKTQVEAAAKLGLSVSALRRRLRRIEASPTA